MRCGFMVGLAVIGLFGLSGAPAVAGKFSGEVGVAASVKAPLETLRVEKGDIAAYDNFIYIHSKVTHCTLDGRLATFSVAWRVPVMMMQHIKDKQLDQIRTLYRNSLETVYRGALGDWVAARTGKDAVVAWEEEADDDFVALVNKNMVGAATEFGEGVRKAVGTLMTGDPDLYLHELEIGAFAVSECADL